MPLFDPVRCPQCQTAISLLPVYRASDVAWLGSPKLPVGVHCPTCGIPLRVLWPGPWLAAAPTLMGVAFGIAVLLWTGLAQGVGFRPEPVAMGVIAIAVLVALMRSRLGARLARVRFLEPNESVAFVLETPLPTEPTREEIEDAEMLRQQRPLGPDGEGAATDPDAPRDQEPETAAGAGSEPDRMPTLATGPDDDPQANEDETDERVDPPPPEADAGADPGEEASDDLPGWECPKCHEDNPGTFGLCWKCNSLRPPPVATAAPARVAGDSDAERKG